MSKNKQITTKNISKNDKFYQLPWVIVNDKELSSELKQLIMLVIEQKRLNGDVFELPLSSIQKFLYCSENSSIKYRKQLIELGYLGEFTSVTELFRKKKYTTPLNYFYDGTDENKEPFLKVYKSFWNNNELGISKDMKLTLSAFIALNRNEFNYSLKKIQLLLNKSISTAYKVRKELEKLGLISMKQRFNGLTNKIKLLVQSNLISNLNKKYANEKLNKLLGLDKIETEDVHEDIDQEYEDYDEYRKKRKEYLKKRRELAFAL